MSKVIPFFSAYSINIISDYKRFFHSKRYIQSKTVSIDTSFKLNIEQKAKINKMTSALGFSNFNKFLKLKKQWDSLNRNIPISYFNYIGLKQDVLEYTLELDYEDYCRTLDIPRYPTSAILRLMAGIYKRVAIPEGLGENEAVDYLFDLMENHRFRFCINYPDLLSLFLEPEGKLNTVYYPPTIHFTEKTAVPVRDGSGMGLSSLG